VRHYSSSQAQAWLMSNNVEARVADQIDVIQMAKNNIEPLGPFESVAQESSPQVSIEDAIDAENRKNAELLHSNGNGEPMSRFSMDAPDHE
jgi:hypothetical protein